MKLFTDKIRLYARMYLPEIFFPHIKTNSRMFAWSTEEVASLSGIPHELSDALS